MMLDAEPLGHHLRGRRIRAGKREGEAHDRKPLLLGQQGRHRAVNAT